MASPETLVDTRLPPSRIGSRIIRFAPDFRNPSIPLRGRFPGEDRQRTELAAMMSPIVVVAGFPVALLVADRRDNRPPE